MSRERDKGNRFERRTIPGLLAIDGPDPAYEQMVTATGRIGNTYHLEVDAITRRFAVECKCRENLPNYFWLATKERPLMLPEWPSGPRLVVFPYDDFLHRLRAGEWAVQMREFKAKAVYLVKWLDKAERGTKIPLVLLGRNHHQPLAVLKFDHYLDFLKEQMDAN